MFYMCACAQDKISLSLSPSLCVRMCMCVHVECITYSLSLDESEPLNFRLMDVLVALGLVLFMIGNVSEGNLTATQ